MRTFSICWVYDGFAAFRTLERHILRLLDEVRMYEAVPEYFTSMLYQCAL